MMAALLQFQAGADKGGNLGDQGPNAGGGAAAPGGAASPAGGQQGVSGSANPAEAALANQTQGTTLGTPQVR